MLTFVVSWLHSCVREKNVDEPRLYAGSAEGETKKPSVSMSSAGSSAWRPERLPPSSPEKGDPSTITATTRVHCVERRDARLVPGEAGVLLYHALDNATTHRGRPVACLEFEEEDAPCLEALLASHAARPMRKPDGELSSQAWAAAAEGAGAGL